MRRRWRERVGAQRFNEFPEERELERVRGGVSDEVVCGRRNSPSEWQSGFGPEEDQGSARSRGELSLGQVLRLRVRHMSDGMALGTRAFVEEVFTLHRISLARDERAGRGRFGRWHRSG